MKISFKRARDIALILIGAFTIVAEFTLAPRPDSTVVLAALGFLFSPIFLKRDEK
jgi:hypothetical protein